MAHAEHAIKEHRVFGPPGTGKTTWTSRQIKLQAEKRGADNIFVASFTRTAAAELAGRDLPLSKDQVGTLHAHCFRALNRPLVAETLIDEWNRDHPQFQLTGGNNNMDEAAVDATFHTDADRVFQEYQVLRAKLVKPEFYKADVRAFALRWEEWKESVGALDFTDMIHYCLQDVRVAPGRPTVGFFDEVQDFTPLELALVRKWAAEMDYAVLAGDDDQAIYAFKGANPDAFLNPPLPDTQKTVLSQSYRVPRAVQELAEKWVAQLTRREPKSYKPRDEEGAIERNIKGTWKHPEPLLVDAEKHLAAGQSVMFLASCSYMLEPVKKVLKDGGVPFHNPYRKNRGDWNPLGGTGRGTSAVDRLLAFLRLNEDIWGDQARIWTPGDLIQWTEALKVRGVLKKGGRDLLEEWHELGQEANLDALFEDQALVEAISQNLDWFGDNLLAARRAGMQFPLQVARKHGPAKLKEQPKIILGTIHSVKGGEADVVYLIPDLSIAGMREWVSRGELRDSIIRQYYVALTRARHTLKLVQPATAYYVNLEVASK